MAYIDENTIFVVEEISDIVKESIEHTMNTQLFQQSMVNKWTDLVIESCLTKLCKLAKPYKYMVSCSIMQKNGAGFHAASSCYWDNVTDGSCTVRWENQTIYVIVSVFGMAI